MVRIRFSDAVKTIALRQEEAEPETSPVAGEVSSDGAAHVRLPVGNIAAARQKAFAQGRQSALDELEDVILAGVRELRQAACELQQMREAEHQQMRDFAIRLACCITQELTTKELQGDEAMLGGIADRILAEVFPDGVTPHARLHGNPTDLALMEEALNKGAGDRLELVPDPGLSRASFRVEAQGLVFDSNICERLELIQERLLREHGDGPVA